MKCVVRSLSENIISRRTVKFKFNYIHYFDIFLFKTIIILNITLKHSKLKIEV